ncbi:MAG TPA: hypothetical protein PLJ50_14515, partial [Candidatus Latescibacteria bacterium]|nr:hypothetical protein [Candidatus Latescibacterota bacterium]
MSVRLGEILRFAQNDGCQRAFPACGVILSDLRRAEAKRRISVVCSGRALRLLRAAYCPLAKQVVGQHQRDHRL